MAQTKAGARKAMETLKAKYGVDEDGKSLFHKTVGAEGGRRSNTGGFYKNRELAIEAGRKGGSISRPPQRKHA